MAHSRLSTALERDQHEAVLRREWRFERAGWAALAIVLVAGLAGVFGDGAFAAASSRSADDVAVLRYERIIRQDAPTELELHLAAASVSDSVVVVSLTEGYLAAMDVERVVPQPTVVRASSGRVDFHLLQPDPSRSVRVRFSIRATTMGIHRAAMAVDGRTLSFWQLVLP